MRVYTCTPVSFKGNHRYFTRESGLFSRALSDLGVESVSVMPGSVQQDDEKFLLRVSYQQLESEKFWKSLNLNGLILYSWALPRYLPIANAVRAAGIPLLINVDSCGLVSRPANPRLWMRDLLPYLCRKATSPMELARLVWQIVDNCGINRGAGGRLKTYEAATVACGVSPMATQWLQREAAYFGKSHLAQKIRYLPHPQMQMFSYNGEPKENLVLSVGRWDKQDWVQKNPAVLLDAIDEFLGTSPDWRACIIGTGASHLVSRLGRHRLANLGRCEFIDFMQPDDLVPFYRKAKIGVWSSRSEGQIGTGAQALCCGCSVVAGNSGTLSCFHHYISRESGRLAIGMSADALAEALMLEADAWSQGLRDPQRISSIWTNEFHSKNVAARGLKMLGLAASSALEIYP